MTFLNNYKRQINLYLTKTSFSLPT